MSQYPYTVEIHREYQDAQEVSTHDTWEEADADAKLEADFQVNEYANVMYNETDYADGLTIQEMIESAPSVVILGWFNWDADLEEYLDYDTIDVTGELDLEQRLKDVLGREE